MESDYVYTDVPRKTEPEECVDMAEVGEYELRDKA